MGGFSKTSYRSRRKAGKRGQGDHFNPIRVVEEGKGGHMVRTSSGFQTVSRRQARQKLRSRWFEDEDDKVGKKFTAKKARHVVGEPKFKGPTYAPDVSNHERVFRQRVKSKRINLDKGDK